MKKQYKQPAFMQIILTNKRLVATSIIVDNEAQDDISGDVKEFMDIDDVIGDVNLWDDLW
ncbi:MAG: hypothetical protein IKQ37_05220 [Bacteroidaceae bacterium]|nr:hypothetical protein [Bacteroidaceae bacterium]